MLASRSSRRVSEIRLGLALWVERRRPGETYETKTEHPQSTNCMQQHSDTKYINIDRADNQVIHKVARREGEDESAAASISIYTLLGGHGFALSVCEHHP